MSEFVCAWFESSQKWIVLFPDGSIIDGEFGSIGYAVLAAQERLGGTEAYFECEEATGTLYRYVKVSQTDIEGAA
jgi:hypothetical protein